MKILVIDDEESFRSMIRALLTKEGYNVVEAENGTAGIEIARSQIPDLIISDVMMPDLDGYQTLEALRSNNATKSIPFIFMTGQKVDRASVRRGMELGADDYLPKPFTANELVSAVRSRLQKHQTVVERAEKKLTDLRFNISLSLPHELRTPLFGILGYAEILKTDYRTLDPETLREMAESIHDSAVRLQVLIENFLIYSQIAITAADKHAVEILRRQETTDLHKLLGTLVKQKASVWKRSADIKTDLHEASAAISPAYFTKIAEGLLENAFKFSSPGTEVFVSCKSDGQRFKFSIRDRGRGMTAEQIADVGSYMQFDRKRHEQQGSGLGLIIAKRLTEIHDGGLAVESTPGSGTIVTVDLPVSPVSASHD